MTYTIKNTFCFYNYKFTLSRNQLSTHSHIEPNWRFVIAISILIHSHLVHNHVSSFFMFHSDQFWNEPKWRFVIKIRFRKTDQSENSWEISEWKECQKRRFVFLTHSGGWELYFPRLVKGERRRKTISSSWSKLDIQKM